MKVEKKKIREVRYVTYRGNRKRTHTERMNIDIFPTASDTSVENPLLHTPLPDTLLAQNVEHAVPSQETHYERKKKLRIEEWTSLRDVFQNIGTHFYSLERSSCDHCGLNDVPLFRCVDCCQWVLLCNSCLARQHSYPHLHIFEGWNCGTFTQYVTETPKWKLHHACSTSYEKNIVVVDDKGRQHVRKICFCSCEQESATLLRYHLWPFSPKRPQLAFHIDLLRWILGLQMECQVSVKGFCEALHARLQKNLKGTVTNEIKDVYSILIKETINEFRLFCFNQDNLGHHIESALDDGTTCAACFDVPTRIYSFDADFQLVRKRSAGRNWETPKHEGRYFLNQTDVDKFMESYDDSSKKGIQVDCNDFQAGSNIRAKIKTAKLSETAVFGSVCRHEVPKYFFSLKHGERLGYSVYLMNKLIEENSGRKLHIQYDIACLLDRHLKKKKVSLPDNVALSIPIFHCYGHKLACQVLFSPRRTEGVGLTDGESMERLWSYLGKFSKMTKEMSPENRVDMLVEGLHHYGKKIQDKIHVTTELVEQWSAEEKAACANLGSQADFSLNSQEEYALNIEILEKARAPGSNTDQKIIEKATTKVEKLEKVLKLRCRVSLDACREDLLKAKTKQHRVLLNKMRKEACDRTYLIELIKKYARGQGIATRLQKVV